MVDKTKFLGVVIDQCLTFSQHIQYTKGKISRSLGILYKCKKYFKAETLVRLYTASIYPYFNYCITVWRYTYSTYIMPLVKLQKRAIRIIASEHRRANTDPIFIKYKLLPLAKICIYLVQLFMFKYEHNCLPEMFFDF